jgi:hypothetical protein
MTAAAARPSTAAAPIAILRENFMFDLLDED